MSLARYLANLLNSSGQVPDAKLVALTASKLTGQVPDANAPSGSVIQVVQTVKLDAFTTTSLTPVDVTGLSVSITPSSASSKILVLAQVAGGPDNATGWYINLVRNSTNLSIGTSGSSYNNTVSQYFNDSTAWSVCPIMYLDSPASTSPTTYKMQAVSGSPGALVAINRRAVDAVIGFSSTITALEISA